MGMMGMGMGMGMNGRHRGMTHNGVMGRPGGTMSLIARQQQQQTIKEKEQTKENPNVAESSETADKDVTPADENVGSANVSKTTKSKKMMKKKKTSASGEKEEAMPLTAK